MCASSEYAPIAFLTVLQSVASSLSTKILAGLVTGGLGSAFVNPADLIKVRFQAERRVHGANPRYRHTWHALKEIYRCVVVVVLVLIVAVSI
jgi:hypothetical protein